MTKILATPMPKSRAGRAPTPLDTELYAELEQALKNAPTLDANGSTRPAGYGPDTQYESEGRATSGGRRFAQKLAEELKITVRVNVYEQDGKWLWRVYIPLSASKEKQSK